MRKHWKLLIAAACLAVLLGVAVLHSPTNEPQYQGRSLTSWLDSSYTQVPSEYTAAANAVQAIGTNAIPFLLKQIRYELPLWRRTLLRTLPASIIQRAAIPSVMSKGQGRANNAVRGFTLLSSNACTAVPELKSMMGDKAHPDTAKRAIEALTSIGAPAFPCLTTALADTNHPFRDEIVTLMGFYMAPEVGTNTCLAPLRAVLDDPDPQVRTMAEAMVNFLTGNSATNTPAP